MAPFLERSPMLRSRDVEETCAFLAQKAIELTLDGPSRHAKVDARINGLYLPNLWLGCIQYGTEATVHLSPDSSVWGRAALPGGGDYSIYLPAAGRFETHVQGRVLVCDEHRAVVLSPCDRYTFRTEARTVRLGLSLRGAALERHLAALLGEPPTAPLQFAPELRLDEGHGARLAPLLRWAAATFDRCDAQARPWLEAEFESFLSTWLLLSQPSNHSAAIARKAPRPGSRDVRCAMEYARENLSQPLTLASLVQAAGVPGRTLRKHFRDTHGVSPMRFVRNLRMERVREALQGGEARAVGETAARWGFFHAGRFSVEYRKRYGESPSATLARRRGG